METIIDEIGRAVEALKLMPGTIERLAPDKSEVTYLAALHHFTTSGHRRWWWESFRNSGTLATSKNGDGWRHITSIVPDPNEQVWFIAEEDQLPHHPVFETTPAIASEVIGQCYAFEYYLIAKDFGWLVCENHHNVVIAIGFEVEKRLSEIASKIER